YQRVEIGPEFETPKGKEQTNPVMALMEEYAAAVKRENYLAKYPRLKHPTQIEFKDAEYVGSAECKSCHAHAFSVWKKVHKGEGGKRRGHPVVYESLVEAKRPPNRQFDGECISCHVVGFPYETGFKDAKTSKHLLGVGCESCHGPCSDHVA